MGRRRVDLRTAAELLSISSDAVRKRAKRGTMPSETGADGRLYVWVDAGESETYPRRGDPQEDRGELVDELRDRVQSLEGQLTQEREANRENRRLLAAALELAKRPAIEAPEPRDAPENAAEPRPSTETPDSDTGQPRASWWRRWFG